MSEKHGGPAFPGEYLTHEVWDDDKGRYVERTSVQSGMTLRDYFAGQVVGEVSDSISNNALSRDEGTARMAAEYAYLVADAMLKEREK